LLKDQEDEKDDAVEKPVARKRLAAAGDEECHMFK
jgi:hypothetical protein